MSVLDIERDRLKKHYLELEDNYEVLKGQTEESLVDLTKIEFSIVKKIEEFVNTYTKIDCLPDFYEMDGFGSKKVKMNLDELKNETSKILAISNSIKDKNGYELAAISILGMKKLVENDKNLNSGLKTYLKEIGIKIIELDKNDEKLSVDLRDDKKIIDFEKRMHSAIYELKDFIHRLESIKNITKKYIEKIKYIDEMYDSHKIMLDEILDVNKIKHWKQLDKDQDVLMIIHGNIILAQLLHDMYSKGLLEDDEKTICYKNFEELINRANEVIEVIDVYTKVNVF